MSATATPSLSERLEQRARQIDERVGATEARLLREAKAEIKRLRRALEKIAAGEGIYGAQAYEYKQIARSALEAAP